MSGSRALPQRRQIRQARSRRVDALFSLLVHLSAMLLVLMLAAIVVSLFIEAMPALRAFGPSFLWRSEWDPLHNQFGALPMIYGTVASAAIALALSVPVSFGIALFLTELAPRWLKRPLTTAIELLAAIPSIVYGMWGLLVFSPVFARYVQQPLQTYLGDVPCLGALFAGPPVGIGILSAGVVLSIMVIPFITSVMCEVFDTTPAMLKESAYGMGATTWEVVTKVVLPYTRNGVLGGIMLGLGRALGETMAVTFVIGNMTLGGSVSLFDAANSITSMLVNEFAEAGAGLHRSAVIALGLVLFLITFAALSLSRLMLRRMRRQQGAWS